MRLPFFLIIIILLTLNPLFAKEQVQLYQVAQTELAGLFSKVEIEKGIKKGIWNHDKTVMASTFGNLEKAKILIFLLLEDTTWKVTDISFVEDINLSKFGLGKKGDYKDIISQPVKWFEGDFKYHVVLISTEAWKNGHRYSSSEPQIIKPNGTVVYR